MDVCIVLIQSRRQGGGEWDERPCVTRLRHHPVLLLMLRRRCRQWPWRWLWWWWWLWLWLWLWLLLLLLLLPLILRFQLCKATEQIAVSAVASCSSAALASLRPARSGSPPILTRRCTS